MQQIPWLGDGWRGVAVAGLAAVGWGFYILLTQRIGDRFTGIGALLPNERAERSMPWEIERRAGRMLCINAPLDAAATVAATAVGRTGGCRADGMSASTGLDGKPEGGISCKFH